MLYGTITNNNVILRFQEFLECIDPGVLERWSIGVLKGEIKPAAITPILHHPSTPILQCSNALKLINNLGFTMGSLLLDFKSET